MIIVPERELVVLTPPRTASTAIRDALLLRYRRAMALYRHRERDGIPEPYREWPVLSIIRHPLNRLWSLYKYMKNIPRHATTGEGKAWIAAMSEDVARPFEAWLKGSTTNFHTPLVGGPYYRMVRYTPITHRSLYDYLLPVHGQTTTMLYKLETEIPLLEEFLDINMGYATDRNATEQTAPPMSPFIDSFLRAFHYWDLKWYLPEDDEEPLEYYGEPPITNAERLESGMVTPR